MRRSYINQNKNKFLAPSGDQEVATSVTSVIRQMNPKIDTYSCLPKCMIIIHKYIKVFLAVRQNISWLFCKILTHLLGKGRLAARENASDYRNIKFAIS